MYDDDDDDDDDVNALSPSDEDRPQHWDHYPALSDKINVWVLLSPSIECRETGLG